MVTRREDILDKGWYYCFGHNSPWIYKKGGKGKVLSLLLEKVGRPVGLETIAQESGWGNVKRNMRELALIVDIWSKSYRIDRIEKEGEERYKLVRRHT